MNRSAAEAPLFEQASQAYAQGQRAQAAQLARRLLQQSPQHTGAWFLLGSVLLDDGRADEALPCLQAAARLAPAHAGILRALGTAYFNLRQWPEAAREFDLALHHGPADAGLLNNFGLALKELGDIEASLDAFRQALQLDSRNASVYNNLAITLNRVHDYAAAIDAYRHSVELEPRNVAVLSNLAVMLEQTNRLDEAEEVLAQALILEPRHSILALVAAKCARRRDHPDAAIPRLEDALQHPKLGIDTRRSLEFELARNYDLLGDTDKAYHHFELGNRLSLNLWPELAGGADIYLAELDSLLAVCTPAWLRALPPAPRTPTAPQIAFLVSFPRSGTTLMDTFLDAHPQVKVLEEEPWMEHTIDRVRALPRGYPHAMGDLDAAATTELQAAYLKPVLRAAPASAGTIVVDKNPFLSAHGAFIQSIIPDARYIFALRHPCDVVLSCFMQPFGHNPILANFLSLESSAHTYRRVMDLWFRYRDNLPLQVHEIRYEQLVGDTPATLHSLLDFLGLKWADGLADHTAHARKRGRIYTPSYHQVIQPLYDKAINRWKRYQRHFGAALEILQPYVERFGYTL